MTKEIAKHTQKMKFLTLSIIAFLHLSCISARYLEHKKGGDFLAELHLLVKQEGMMNTFSLKTILMNYMESKYPGIEKKRQTMILKVLARKIKEDMLARMLK